MSRDPSDPSKFVGYDEARRAALAYQTPRYCRLAELKRWVEGKQYQGRPSWWSDAVPLWERAPCFVYPAAQIAISSNVDLVFGEGRAPDFTTGTEDEGDAEGGLDSAPKGEGKPSDSQVVDRFIRDYHRISRFKSHCREAFAEAQGVGSACAIHGVWNDKPYVELVPAEWGTPEFSSAGTVDRLVIQYSYFQEYRLKDGQWAIRCMLYKREIDQTTDITFLPAVADPEGRPVTWTPDPQKTISHGLGFCPVVWYAFMKGGSAVNVIDGKAIHHQITDEIFAHDMALSQWHRSALLSEPQMVETGVTAGYNPTDPGRVAEVPSTLEGGHVTGDNPRNGGYRTDDGQKPARKKGPGYVWTYPDDKTKVYSVAIPGEALRAMEENAKDKRLKLQELFSVVLLDPEHLKVANELSGKALAALKQKQIDRCDQYRDDLNDCFLLPSIEMQLRIAQVARPNVPNLEAALPLLASIPTIRTLWGPYARPDALDEQNIVTMVRLAMGKPGEKPIITLKMAVEKIKDLFGVENVDAVVAELEAQQAEQEAKDQAAAEAEAKLKAPAPKAGLASQL